MAHTIEDASIDPETLVVGYSRYVSSKPIYYGRDRKLTFKTYKKGNYPLSSQDKYMVITPGAEFRPDLIAFDVYGITDVWWRIMEANNIKDVFDFRSGVTIRLPANIFT